MSLSRRWRRSLFGSLLFPGLALALLLGGWLAVYAYDKGFSKKWRRFIREEFRERGVELDFSRLTIDPLQGLVAREVRIYDSRERRLKVAAITGIKIDADLIKVAGGRNFINSVDLDDVDLLIPLNPDDAGEETLAVHHLSARAYFLRDRIEVRKITAELAGIDVEFAGSLRLREDEEEEKDPSRSEGIDPELIRTWQRHLSKLTEWLERVEFFDEGVSPKLEIRIEGDLANPEDVLGNLQFVSGPLRIGDARFDSAAAVVDLRSGELFLRSLELVDGQKRIEAHGRYRLGDQVASFRVDADADLPGLALSFLEDPGVLGELVFYDAPSIRAEGRWDFSEEKGERCIFGRFECDRFASRGMLFGGGLDFSFAPEKFFVRNLRLEHQSGNLAFQCLKQEEGFRYNAILRMDPSALVPFVVRDGMRKLLQSFSMGRDSGIHLEISGEGPGLDSRTWSSRGHFDLRDFEFRGTHFDRVEGDLSLDGLLHHYEDIRVSRPEGTASGTRVTVDNGNGKRTQLVGIAGDLDAGAVVRCFHQPTADRLKPYRFDSPPRFEIDGTIAGKGQTGQTDLQVKFQSKGPASTDLLGRTWRFSQVGGDVRIGGGGVNTDLSGVILGGRLDLDCKVSGGIVQGEILTDDLDFDQVVGMFGGSGERGGSLDLDCVFRTRADKEEWFDARGGASLTDADIFAIPVLGPLSPLISAILPGDKRVGYGVAKSASANFIVDKGVLETDSFEALTQTFKLGAKGQIDLKSLEIVADASMNLKGSMGILFTPVSKLLEFRATGSAKNPRWVPKRLVRPLGGKAKLD